MSRSDRLAASLLSSSTTPRTTRRLLEEMTLDADRSYLLYTEVKQAMTDRDVSTAQTLLDQIPRRYRNAETYRTQCNTFDALCKQGVIQREGTEVVRQRLSDILQEAVDSQDVLRYANALLSHGYNLQAIEACTIHTMEDAMHVAEMTEGHRQLFAAYAETNTSVPDKAWMRLLSSLHKCAPILSCVQSTGDGLFKKKTSPDETAETTLVRWKTTETLFNLATKEGEDDETAGDE